MDSDVRGFPVIISERALCGSSKLRGGGNRQRQVDRL